MSAEFRNSDDTLESALCQSSPRTEFPPELHQAIMRRVYSARRGRRDHYSSFRVFRYLAENRWLPATGFAALIALGAWLTFDNQESPITNPQSLPQVSAAFAASQQIVDTLPSVTVGLLSDELDKVNEDLTRTGEFLLATLP